MPAGGTQHGDAAGAQAAAAAGPDQAGLDTSAAACHQQRPRTASSNLGQRRPCRPASAAPWLPAGRQYAHSQQAAADAAAAAAGRERARPASAVSALGSRAALSRLKAELAQLAAGAGVQLQSLRPGAPAVDCAADLQAAVLQQLERQQLLQAPPACTYSEARAAAAAAAAAAPAHTPERGTGDSCLTQLDGGAWRPRQQQHTAVFAGAAAADAGGIEPGTAAAAAAAALAEMRQWAADQELRMTEPSIAARYPGKAVAARLSMLRLEAQALQYERRFYEAELARLASAPGFGHCGGTDAEHGLDAPLKAAHSFASWTAGASSPGVDGGSTSRSGSRSGSGSGSDTSSCSNSESEPDEACSRQGGRAADSETQHHTGAGRHHRKQRHALAATARGYLGCSVPRRSALTRTVSRSSDVLQLSHSGLRPQQLAQVAAGLAAAPWVTRLDLSGNMLTDAAIAELAQLLLMQPSTAAVSQLDLSHNQLLTWQCCTALAQLLAGPPPAAESCGKHAGAGVAGSSDTTWQRPSQQGAHLQAAGAGTQQQATHLQLPPPAATPQQLLHVLQLRVLCLESVELGDRGAALLAGTLAAAHHLEVLDLSRCGIHDAGGAAICTALPRASRLQQLNLSWNALSHDSAKAVEAALRHPTPCQLSQLSLSHCGLDDRHGSLILNALIPAGSGAASPASWTRLDLSFNKLEGGAALCAAALIAAVAAEAPASSSCGGGSSSSSTSSSDKQQQAALPAAPAAALACADQAAPGGLGRRRSSAKAQPAGASDVAAACKRLLLDGNPLGAAGMRVLMRALAGQPVLPGLAGGAVQLQQSQPPQLQQQSQQQSQPPQPEQQQQLEQQQQQAVRMSVFVSVSKVALLAREKGLRSSMRDAQSASMASQVPTLLHALELAPKAKALKGVSPPKPGKAARPATPAPAAAAPTGDAAAAARPALAFLVVTENAAGFDLACPAGQYRLALSHPASKHLFSQLLDLRAGLQQLAQQVKQQQVQAAAVPLPAPAASAPPAPAQPANGSGRQLPAGQGRSGSVSPAGGRAGTPPSPQSGAASPSPTSRRASRTGSIASSAAKSGKRRVRACTVEVPSFADLRLDGRPVKFDQLLALQPWYTAAAPNPADEGRSTPEAAAAAEAAQAAAAERAATPGSATPVPGQLRRRRGCKQLEFSLRAAAVLVGQDPPVLPAQLQAWALQVLRHASCSDVWKLQLLELLLADWLLTPEQAVELLGVFDRELGQEERLTAAGLVWARLVQPAAFWGAVLPATLRPLQQQAFKAMLGPQLMALDRHNLTGPWALNLSWAVHRAVAQRLQLAALQDTATSECRYYLSWRNASLDGRGLPDEALAALHAYAVPGSGSLRLDYVSYQVPDASCLAAAPSQLRALLAGLRRVQADYNRQLLALRAAFLPGGRLARASSPKLEPAAAVDAPAGAAEPLVLPGQGAAWWEASGFDATALLLKHRPVSGRTSALATPLSAASPAPAGPARSRRGTRDALADAARGAARRSTGSRPSSAAVAGGLTPPAAGTPSRRATRSRVSRSPQLPGTPGSAGTAGVREGGGGGVTDEQLLARLLAAASPPAASAVFARLGTRHAASVLGLLASMPQGPAAVAALLELLPPLVAGRFMLELPDQADALLPAAVRVLVQPLLLPARAQLFTQLACALQEAACERNSQQLLLVRRFASDVGGVTCGQVAALLQLLGSQGQRQRCSAIVALWAKVMDRAALVQVFEALSGSEQLGLMTALGAYHVWSSLGAPDGLHFRLDLTQPEQRDVAREVVKVAVRRSLAEAAASGARPRQQQLHNFTAEGKPVADPEDDKLWLSMESKHTLLEFDYLRTWEQELHVTVGAVKRIQRAWRRRAAGISTPASSGRAAGGSLLTPSHSTCSSGQPGAAAAGVGAPGHSGATAASPSARPSTPASSSGSWLGCSTSTGLSSCSGSLSSLSCYHQLGVAGGQCSLTPSASGSLCSASSCSCCCGCGGGGGEPASCSAADGSGGAPQPELPAAHGAGAADGGAAAGTAAALDLQAGLARQRALTGLLGHGSSEPTPRLGG